MSYRVSGLSPDPFRHLFGLPDVELAAYRAQRLVAGPDSGMPDRVELRDAREGEAVILVNHEHHAVDTPFRATHAIFVLEHAQAAVVVVDEVPEVLRTRLLSIRAFSADGMMVDADIVDGTDAETLIGRLFEAPEVEYLHAHYARRGCYAALVERAL